MVNVLKVMLSLKIQMSRARLNLRQTHLNCQEDNVSVKIFQVIV